MRLLGSFIIAISMYSRIPMPRISWTKERMEYVMCFFPFVGVALGTLYLVWGAIYERLGGSLLWYAAVGTVLPILLTGGIHMDGFLDVMDAKSSCQDRQKKLEIMKDPHTGAFAIISCGTYLLLYAGFFAELPAEELWILAAVPVISRSFSGLSVVLFPKAKKDGLAVSFSRQSRAKTVAAVLIGFLLLGGAWIWQFGGPVKAVCLLGSGLLWFGWYDRMTRREFGGVTGDLAGYFLEQCELILLIVAVLCHKIMG